MKWILRQLDIEIMSRRTYGSSKEVPKESRAHYGSPSSQWLRRHSDCLGRDLGTAWDATYGAWYQSPTDRSGGRCTATTCDRGPRHPDVAITADSTRATHHPSGLGGVGVWRGIGSAIQCAFQECDLVHQKLTRASCLHATSRRYRAGVIRFLIDGITQGWGIN